MHHQLAKLLYSLNKYPSETRRYWRVLSKHEMRGDPVAGAVQDRKPLHQCQQKAPRLTPELRDDGGRRIEDLSIGNG